ncbi:MMPL family transporter [Candidatus Saccharibacteria bacterium]|nr:MAG: MMPL family transporter [Candidatus Saccharibacteria bacterium]
MAKTERRGVPKWLRVVIPTVLIGVWLAASAIGGPYFGRVDEVSDSDLSAFLPRTSDAAKVNDAAGAFRSEDTIPAIVLFEAKDSQMLSDDQVASLKTVVTDLEGVDGVTSKDAELIKSDDGKAAFAALPVETNGEVDVTVAAMNDVVTKHPVDGVNHWITGPAGFLADLSKAFGGIDGVLLLVALGVVLVILLLVYRSPILPILVLLGAVCALSAALLVVWWLAKWEVLQLNGQVQGILFILVIGAATDYSLLLVSRYREELFKHESKSAALWNAWKGVLEPIGASGGTVMVGLLCLLVSDLGSNKALGPVGAIGVAFAMLAALTFLPAMLYAVGRIGFWPRVPRADKKSVTAHEVRQAKGVWHRVGEFVSRYPRPIWIVTILVLLLGASGLSQLKANGVPQSELILGYSAAREGQQVLTKHFPGGSGSPMLVLVPEDQQDKVTSILDADRGVDGMTVTATGVKAGFKPLGKQAQSIKDEIRTEIKKKIDEQKAALNAQAEQIAASAGPFGEQAKQQFLDSVLPNIPSVDSLVDEAYPFKDAKVTVVVGKVLLSATLVDEPYSDAAEATVKRVRAEMPEGVLVGGTTSVTVDTLAASEHDRMVIIPLVLAAITIILMLLLRSIVAPVLLLATTVVSFGTALGVAAYMFNHVWQFPGADPSVVLYGFVFLVALGIDYNIFLMTRVREESKKFGTREGVIKGLIVTGSVITSAGIVLAATFAALSVIPILFLAQIAFVVAFGVLLDTIIVRSLLVPALIRDIGSPVWWPSKLRHKK